jgi:hypothetical protein
MGKAPDILPARIGRYVSYLALLKRHFNFASFICLRKPKVLAVSLPMAR